MENERREIILKEIKYWKNTKLLPEQYCNYLIALYTEGEGIEESKLEQKQRGPILLYIDMIFLLLLIPFSMFTAYFFEFHILIKTTLFIILFGFLLIHYYYYKKKYIQYVHLPIILLFLVLLMGSLTITNYLIGPGLWLNVLILLNCLLWIIVGFIGKYLYLTLSGFLGIIILIIVIVI